MKILLTLAAASANLSGVSRHVLNVAQCLLTRGEIAEVHLAIAPWQRNLVTAELRSAARLHIHCVQMGRSALARNIWYYRELPKLAGEIAADIVHLGYPVPIARSSFRVPVMVTLHDLYPYDIAENFGFPKVLVNQWILRHCLENVDTISCVSNAALERLRTYFPEYAEKKSTCIPNCVVQANDASAAVAVKVAMRRPFILCVAQHRRNKNIPLVIEAFSDLLQAGRLHWKTQLLIVGIEGPETAYIKRRIHDLALQHRVVLQSGVSDQELTAMYRTCEVLVAPSSIEGFGLPVAEGLLAGCRIVCSDIPAFREIAGHRCAYLSLDGNVRKNLADAVAESIGSPQQRPHLLPELSVPVIAESYIQLYQYLNESPGIRRVLPPLQARGVLYES